MMATMMMATTTMHQQNQSHQGQIPLRDGRMAAAAVTNSRNIKNEIKYEKEGEVAASAPGGSFTGLVYSNGVGEPNCNGSSTATTPVVMHVSPWSESSSKSPTSIGDDNENNKCGVDRESNKKGHLNHKHQGHSFECGGVGLEGWKVENKNDQNDVADNSFADKQREILFEHQTLQQRQLQLQQDMVILCSKQGDVICPRQQERLRQQIQDFVNATASIIYSAGTIENNTTICKMNK